MQLDLFTAAPATPAPVAVIATVPMRHVQGSESVPVRASTPCVLALRHDAVRDGVLRDEAPRGTTWLAVELPVGCVAWVSDDGRWRAMERVEDGR